MTLRLLLPDAGTGYELMGKTDVDLSAGGQRYVRHAALDGAELRVSEQVESAGGELPAAQVAAEKGAAARIASSAPFLLSPASAARNWEYGRAELKQRLGPYEKAYALAIAREPDEANSYLNRARFRAGVTDFRAALPDFDKAIELDPDADSYTARAQTWWALGEVAKATADYRQAYELSPSAETAVALAEALGVGGGTDEALALLDEFDGKGDDHTSVVQTRADVLAQGGRAEEGLALIDELITEKPGQGEFFNTSCWYRARFRVGLGWGHAGLQRRGREGWGSGFGARQPGLGLGADGRSGAGEKGRAGRAGAQPRSLCDPLHPCLRRPRHGRRVGEHLYPVFRENLARAGAPIYGLRFETITCGPWGTRVMR